MTGPAPSPASGRSPGEALQDLLGSAALEGVGPEELPPEPCQRLLTRFARQRQALGQYFTPPPLAALTTALALPGPVETVLDPCAGTGVFLRSIRRRCQEVEAPEARVVGLELDPDLAALARCTAPEARIVTGSFLTAPPPGAPFDAVIGNPPYSRQQGLEVGPGSSRVELAARLSRELGEPVSARSSAYIYFLLLGLSCLRPGGRLALIVPNAWLDVAAGRSLRHLCTRGEFQLVALVESAAEHWFTDARINAVVTVVDRPAGPAGPPAPSRFVTLRRPLSTLPDADGLARRLLTGPPGEDASMLVRELGPGELAGSASWSRHMRRAGGGVWPGTITRVPLGELVEVHRGHTTGANGFFYLPAECDLEPAYLRPLLKSPRELVGYRLGGDRCRWRVLQVEGPGVPPGSRVAAHLARGEREGVHRRVTCKQREPWYALPSSSPPPLVLAKGVWQRWVVARTDGTVAIDQQLYGLYPHRDCARLVGVLWGILNTAATMVEAELTGRTSFGEGVLWLATYEVANLPVVDPRRLTSASRRRVTRAMRALARTPVAPRAEVVQRISHRELELAVLESAGLSPRRARAVARELAATAVSLAAARQSRATGRSTP